MSLGANLNQRTLASLNAVTASDQKPVKNDLKSMLADFTYSMFATNGCDDFNDSKHGKEMQSYAADLHMKPRKQRIGSTFNVPAPTRARQNMRFI